jgi:hypothetical protein
MPQTQAASVSTYDFGAPSALATVLTFRVMHGGLMQLRFESADGAATGVVTMQRSADNITYANTTAAENTTAVVAQNVARAQPKDFSVSMRDGVDNYMRVQASGGTRLQLQIRSAPDDMLEIIRI